MRLAEDGLDVVINDIPANESKFAEVVTELEGRGVRAVSVTGDALAESNVENIVAVAVKELGGPDVVSSLQYLKIVEKVKLTLFYFPGQFVANAAVNLLLPLLDGE